LGVLGIGIQLWRDPLFPYSRLDTVWTAVSLVPERVVVGTGIRLLFFALLSTAFGIGVSVLVVRALILLGRNPAKASGVGKGGAEALDALRAVADTARGGGAMGKRPVD
jgi:hypothetical protein